MLGVSLLTGERHPVTEEELAFLLAVPADGWLEAGDDGGRARSLAERGLLVAEDGGERLAELRGRDEALADGRWNLYAGLYHFLTRWSGVDMRAEAGADPAGELPPITRELVDEFVAAFGPPPDAFHAVEAPRAFAELPLVRRDGRLFDVLRRRRTTRSFDVHVPLALDDLATMLYEVWGCHGTAQMTPGHPILKKTSPSAGGLHAIEAYPLLTNVEGLEPGFYHYDVRRHALALVAPVEPGAARDLATELLAGQHYFGAAHAIVFMAARFGRSHWKYRRHDKAYAAVLLDAGHLSQTLYLVAAELGLGAFVTAALNARDVDRLLGLDGVEHGVVAVAGCGPRTAAASAWEPRFAEYVPRETQLRRPGL